MSCSKCAEARRKLLEARSLKQVGRVAKEAYHINLTKAREAFKAKRDGTRA